MKAACIILSTYLFALSFFPCGDSMSCADEKKAGVAISNVEDHDHSGSETDLCSPFCICSCCSANVQVNPSQAVQVSTLADAGLFTEWYCERHLPNSTSAIWQPPKI